MTPEQFKIHHDTWLEREPKLDQDDDDIHLWISQLGDTTLTCWTCGATKNEDDPLTEEEIAEVEERAEEYKDRRATEIERQRVVGLIERRIQYLSEQIGTYAGDDDELDNLSQVRDFFTSLLKDVQA